MNITIIIGGLIVVIIILIIALVLQSNKNKTEPYVATSKPIPYNVLYQSPGLIQDYNPINVDILKQYDYHKAFDPLIDPTRRVPSYEIPPYYIKRSIDLPTRGYPDNFTQLGILIREPEKHYNSFDSSQNASSENLNYPKENLDKDNRILRLFGRQEYPGSNKYEYYTAINSCPDQIKIPLNTKRKWELYDGDIVHVPELNESYRVKLYKYDAPKYYPDLI